MSTLEFQQAFALAQDPKIQAQMRSYLTEGVTDEIRELGEDIFSSCRQTLMTRFRFLNVALWHMPVQIDEGLAPLGTDGKLYYFSPLDIIMRYRAAPTEIVRELLHVILHCIFRHPLDHDHDFEEAWSLACDVMVESLALEMCEGRFLSETDAERLDAVKWLRDKYDTLSPAKLYRVFLDSFEIAGLARGSGQNDLKNKRSGVGSSRSLQNVVTMDEIRALQQLFTRDDHRRWMVNADKRRDSQEEQNGPTPDYSQQDRESANDESSQSDSSSSQQHGDFQNQGQGQSDKWDDKSHHSNQDSNDDSVERTDRNDEDSSAESNNSSQNEPALSESLTNNPNSQEEIAPEEEERLRQDWEDIARQIEMEIQSQSRNWSENAGSLMAQLSIANRKRYNYRNFLKRFCAPSEDMRINDEEFDYVYYTFGLERYKNMPLVEPLEYKDYEQIREFVIAIDTSGSCSGDLVQAFIQRTYDILRDSETFGSSVNVHIVQCDARVQADTKITSLRELDRYLDSFELFGFGGTDFRPVFSYVNTLVNQGEFENLQGLIYFTDGLGTYPKKQPMYDTAFVFVTDELASPTVPPWAMKLILSEDEVYGI